MKQVLSSLKTGKVYLEEIPCPQPSANACLIQTSHSLISAGTEKMLVDFGKANWIEKARQQPDKVKMVLDKVSTDGISPTLESISSKLDQPLPLGYCNVGRVVKIGANVSRFRVGDRVVSNGPHAEFVTVSENLCALVPEKIEDEPAAFTVLGSIALQGIRLIQPSLGETIVVTGLGLIGLMAVQLLRAHGCRVIGLDFNSERCKMAEQFGAFVVDLSKFDSPISKVNEFTKGLGVDGVLLTASTQSNEPVSQAAEMCRQRGRIVLVGIAGLELSRADFYKKEITFQVSCSYGPGRYDPVYEEQGFDYPFGFVRWTASRNFDAVLHAIEAGALSINELISHRFDLSNIPHAYDLISSTQPSLGVIINYGINSDPRSIHKPPSSRVFLKPNLKNIGKSVSFIGAGNYATRTLAPAFAKAGAALECIVSKQGISGTHLAKKLGFNSSSTNPQDCFSIDGADTVVIATRHNTHADLVISGLQAGKNVFVEKPLAITADELNQIKQVYSGLAKEGNAPLLMVGFNRRFAPLITKMKELLSTTSKPRSIILTINAGEIPADHWTQDPVVGGGRIIGEACHFIDLARFLAESQIKTINVNSAGGSQLALPDTATVSLSFENGSHATINYLSNGSKSFPKERIEVFVEGKILQLDNFRILNGYGWKNFKRKRLFKQDKGQQNCVLAFMSALEQGRTAPISFDELIESSNAAIKASLESKGSS